jgi:selenocysteine lyase/cysteine desulfurase
LDDHLDWSKTVTQPTEAQTMPPFGHQALPLFSISPQHRQLNHGSYGSVPIPIQQYQRKLQEQTEAFPDKWFRLDSVELYRRECDAAARWLGINDLPETVALCKNTSTGVTSITRSILHLASANAATRQQNGPSSGLEKPIGLIERLWELCRSLLFNIRLVFVSNSKPSICRYRILCLDIAYIQVRRLLEYLERTDPLLEIIKVPVESIGDGPLTHQAIQQSFADTISRYHSPQTPVILAIIDVIASVPAIILPYRQLTRICHQCEPSIPVLWDAAHAVGQIEFQPTEPQVDPVEWPDFAVTNFHKWAFAGRGCAAVYCTPAYHDRIVPAVVSAGYPGTLRDRFMWYGTDDYSSLLTVEQAWSFRRSEFGGEQAIRSYTHQLAVEGGRLVARILKTEMMFDWCTELIPSMVCVRLPPSTAGTDERLARLGLDLLKDYGVYVVTFKFRGEWWLRLSAQVFNQLDDFAYCAESVKSFLVK